MQILRCTSHRFFYFFFIFFIFYFYFYFFFVLLLHIFPQRLRVRRLMRRQKCNTNPMSMSFHSDYSVCISMHKASGFKYRVPPKAPPLRKLLSPKGRILNCDSPDDTEMISIKPSRAFLKPVVNRDWRHLESQDASRRRSSLICLVPCVCGRHEGG